VELIIFTSRISFIEIYENDKIVVTISFINAGFVVRTCKQKTHFSLYCVIIDTSTCSLDKYLSLA